jgi:hypothetical protein
MSNTELANEVPKGIRYLELSDRIWWKAECQLAPVNAVSSLDI